ncbi:MAG: esterase-like activity of phytase family protein [Betaproteobacteria bacterium]
MTASRLVAAAVLVGFARLPADTFAPGPPSGRHVTPAPGLTLPFPSQPVQGFSSIAPIPGRRGWFYALADNGYGTKANSDDFLLRIYRVRPDFDGGGVDVDPSFIQMADPDRRCGFAIVNERAPGRMLTGADFDPESLVVDRDGTFWVGDEFGPFILHVAPDGRLLDPPAEADGLRSPDNPALAQAVGKGAATVARSRGFEGLAAMRERGRLLAALEAGPEGVPPNETRLLEFDTAAELFTRREWTYVFDAPGHSLTELVAAGGSRFVAIERDNGQGPAARFKRVFRVVLGAPGRPVAKTLLVDLLAIDNPSHVGGFPSPFAFPFITPEAVWPLDSHTLIVVDDNNYPETGGRAAGVRDATEFIEVHVR